jgi:phenylpyruvate tautomerase PptA (4-oxalocrotonate tautomerase family)
MPLLSITTNQLLTEADRPQVLKQLSASVAEVLGKPERYVMVSYQHNPHMLFGGSDAPLAYLELKSIGLPGDKTGTLSAALTEAMQTYLRIPVDRVYIEFADAERHMWGWNGGTFG